MKVRKGEPNVLRTVKASVRKANLGIRRSRQSIRRGLTSSVIGEEEPQAPERSRKGSGLEPKGQKNFEQLMFGKGGQRQSQTYRQETYWQEQERQARYRNMWESSEGAGKNPEKNVRIYKNGTTACDVQKGETLQGEQKQFGNATAPQAAAGGRSLQKSSRGTAGMAAQSQKGAAPTTGMAMKATAVKGTTAMAGAAAEGTAVKGGAVIGTAAGTTAGAATGGTVTAAMALTKAAKRAEERVREALEASEMGKSKASGKAKEEQDQQPKQQAVCNRTGILFALAGIPALLLILIASILLVLVIGMLSVTQQPVSGQIVEVARQEAASWEENIGGTKYKNWYGMDADWCAMFVSWCAEQCGYIESGIMPKTASVASMKSWYQQKGQYHAKESGYEPKAGDVIIFGNGRSHTGLVVTYDSAARTVTTVEGNTGSSETTPYHKGSRVKEKIYPLTYMSIVGYGSPAYPGETIEIPEPYGTEYSYMGWQMITSPSSLQYKLRQEAGMNFDEHGFGKIGERYVIACTLTFGKVGDYVDWELDNGTVIKTVVGDIKNQNDPGCNAWGHKNGLCVLEFVVDKYSWYGSGRYPTDFHAEWSGRVVRSARVGNYWN